MQGFHCILGMHRSGTSTVARIANILGLYLGDETEVASGRPDNPKGFWEHPRIVALNERVLRELEGGWADPPPLPRGWEETPRLDPLRRTGASLLDQVFGGRPLAGWKDPRTSLLLPFWRTIADLEPSVLVLRDPGVVAHSLARRDGFKLEHGAYLWLRYISTAWLDDPRHLVIRYEDLRTEVVATTHRLADHLGVERPTEKQLEEIAAFYDPGLRRSERPERVSGPFMAMAYHLEGAIAERSRSSLEPMIEALHSGWPTVNEHRYAQRASETSDRRVVRLAVRIADVLDSIRRVL